MLDVKKVILILALRNGLILKGSIADSKLLRFKHCTSRMHFAFVIRGLDIVASRVHSDRLCNRVVKRFDLFNDDSLSKLNDFMS